MTALRKPATTPLTCADLHRGEEARVIAVKTREGLPDHRLSALGVVRGAVVHVLQTRPCFVIRCDETEIAIEESIARTILVQR